MVAGKNARFLTLAEAAEVLNTTQSQIYALVKRGDLRGIQIGNRNQWRVEVSELEAYIERRYAAADEMREQGVLDES